MKELFKQVKVSLKKLKQLVREEIVRSEKKTLSEAMYIDDLAAINIQAAKSWLGLVEEYYDDDRKKEVIDNSMFEVENKNTMIGSLPGFDVSYIWTGKNWIENV